MRDQLISTASLPQRTAVSGMDEMEAGTVLLSCREHIHGQWSLL